MKDPRVHIYYAQIALDRITQLTADGRLRAKERSWIEEEALLRTLHTLVESVRALEKIVGHQYAEWDWKGMSGFRNALVHQYLELDWKLIWEAIDHELPQIQQLITDLAAEQERRG